MAERVNDEGASRGVRRRTMALIFALELVLCVAIVSLVIHNHGHHATTVQREAGLPSSVSTHLAGQMGLSPLDSVAERDFTLTDQGGHRVTLAALRGKVVVLQFMDSLCRNDCPIASAEVVDAYHDLGARKSDVVFVTVNVNRYADTSFAARALSSRYGLRDVPTWHFVFGPVATLRSVWHNYDVQVDNVGPTQDVTYSEPLYFISPSGKVRFLAMTSVEHTATGVAYLPTASELAWGRGIAEVATSLLS